MKRSLTLFLLGASTVVGAATLGAQPPAAGTPGASARDGRQDGTGRHGGMDRHGGTGRRGGRADGALLRGVTLTDAQQAQVRAVRERYRSQYQQLREQARTSRPQGRRGANGAAPDSAARAAWRAQREAFGTRVRDVRQREAAEVRAVLTPAQQATFDRNVNEMRTRLSARRNGARPMRGPNGRAGV